MEYKSKEVIFNWCKTLKHPQLEYCVQFWAPLFRKDVKTLERAQKTFTRLFVGLRNFTNENGLDSLELFSLENRI